MCDRFFGSCVVARLNSTAVSEDIDWCNKMTLSCDGRRTLMCCALWLWLWVMPASTMLWHSSSMLSVTAVVLIVSTENYYLCNASAAFNWTDYKISYFVCLSVSQSVSHTKRVERSTDRNLPPIFTKLATKVESMGGGTVYAVYA